MKPVSIKNITLQFDSSEDVDEGMIETMIELVNTTLSDVHSFSQPQIIRQWNTKVKVIDLTDL